MSVQEEAVMSRPDTRNKSNSSNKPESSSTAGIKESQEVQNLKRDLDALRRDLARLSNTLVTEARSGAEQWLGEFNDRSQKMIHQAETKIGERPFLSLLVSFVLGVVLAKTLDRGNH